MRIAIGVHGRFHAFDLARALLERGHEVTVFTNYPRWAATRFGLPPASVRSFWLHGIAARACLRFRARSRALYPEGPLHRTFGRWLAKRLARERWDVAHLFSGVAEEALLALSSAANERLLLRGSAHIRVQARILSEEEGRTSARIDRPSDWMVAREEREYRLADHICVLSSFAFETFVSLGVPPSKLVLHPLGTRVDRFRPKPEVLEARCRRILSGEPLRVLYVGALSFQKGLWDLADVVRALAGEGFEFRLVGPKAQESLRVLSSLSLTATVCPKVRQADLPNAYAWGDVFVFPTLHDGYAQVLAEASASALPILTTTNCSGPDFIRDGENGWVLPIRRPDLIVQRLRRCEAERRKLGEMVRSICVGYRPRDWSEVAADFESICKAVTRRPSGQTAPK